MRNAFLKSMASSLLTSDRNDISSLLRTTERNGRLDLRHGGRSLQLELHLARKFRHHFVQIEQLLRLQRPSSAQCDNAS
jgi:hypothetical protein